MVDFQLMQFVSRVGYTIETIDGEDPCDPLSPSFETGAHRIRWPGIVLSIPTLREGYEFKEYQPQGSGPDVQIQAKTSARFEVEIESLVNADFLTERGGGIHDIVALCLGRMRGQVAHDEGTPTFVIGEVVTGTTSGATGVVTASVANLLTFRPTSATLFISGEELTSAGEPSAGPNTTGLPFGEGPIILDESINGHRTNSFSLEYLWRDDEKPGSDGDSHAYRLEGCRIESIYWTARPEDLIMMRTKIVGRLLTDRQTEIVAGGDKISDLVEHDNPGLHYKDIIFAFTDSDLTIAHDEAVPTYAVGEQINGGTSNAFGIVRKSSASLLQYTPTSGTFASGEVITGAESAETSNSTGAPIAASAIVTDVLEWDMTIINSYMPKYADNQLFEVTKFVEGKRRVTFNFKTIKQDNRFVNISRSRPAFAQGQLGVNVIYNQALPPVDGWFMDINMPKCPLGEHDAPYGQDIEIVEESFASTITGAPVIVMKR